MTMRVIAALTAIALLTSTTGLALAESCKGDRTPGPGRQTVSIEAMKGQIDHLGYHVRHLETEDRCFKARIIDRESGNSVRAIFSIATGELLQAELDD
jgi:hypothetical protein